MTWTCVKSFVSACSARYSWCESAQWSSCDACFVFRLWRMHRWCDRAAHTIYSAAKVTAQTSRQRPRGCRALRFATATPRATMPVRWLSHCTTPELSVFSTQTCWEVRLRLWYCGTPKWLLACARTVWQLSWCTIPRVKNAKASAMLQLE